MTEIFHETIPVRRGEELDEQVLDTFIREQIEGVPEGQLMIEQFGAGHSNLTYLLRVNNWEAVLRRPPHGPVAPKAHDMKREYTILKSLYKRSEEHTSELQSRFDLVCRLLLEKK